MVICKYAIEQGIKNYRCLVRDTKNDSAYYPCNCEHPEGCKWYIITELSQKHTERILKKGGLEKKLPKNL